MGGLLRKMPHVPVNACVRGNNLTLNVVPQNT